VELQVLPSLYPKEEEVQFNSATGLGPLVSSLRSVPSKRYNILYTGVNTASYRLLLSPSWL